MKNLRAPTLCGRFAPAQLCPAWGTREESLRGPLRGQGAPLQFSSDLSSQIEEKNGLSPLGFNH